MNRQQFEPSPLAAASCATDGDRWVLIFVRDLRHPPHSVWAALTDPGQLSEWAPFLADRDLGTVGDATLTMIDGDTAQPLAATVSRGREALDFGWDDLRGEYATKLEISGGD